MNLLLKQFLALLLLTVLGAGCGKSPNPVQQASELEATVAKLAAAQPASNRAVMDQALAAIRAKDYVGAVVRLEAGKRNAALSGGQRLEIEQAIRAVSAQLTARALRGDQTAVADLQAIERTRSQ